MARAEKINHKASRFSGYTLIEMLIGLAVLAILVSLTTTTYFSWQRTHEQNYVIQEFISQLKFAREYAIESNQTVVVCPSVNRKNCVSHWDNEIIVKTKDKLLRTLPHSKLKIVWNSSFSKNNHLEFTPIGATNAQQGTFILNNKHGHLLAKILVNQAGRIRVQT